MHRGKIHRLLAMAVLLPALGLAALATADILGIGHIPAPCSRHHLAHTTALVLSGAPRYRRTQQAIALYRRNEVDRIVFSGAGYGGDSARRLAHEARRRGIPDTHIDIEDRARSTAQNFRYACALESVSTAPRVAIVTDRFHAYRAWATAQRQCQGLELCSAPVAGSVSLSRRFSEAGKLLAYQLLDRAAFW
ncbi:YdcF family protein [Salinisphaera sp. SPP-AMP-43]|uniref:YdcF family protein n=1 Tax=Salinisphaera sp. SPP-AMP-43 TaxID=3121288 RepID=UPI003C6E01D0